MDAGQKPSGMTDRICDCINYEKKPHMVISSMISEDTIKRHITLLCCAVTTAALLSSCTTYQRAYSPDQQPPSRQPRTQKPYIVNGKRYEPLSDHQGFEQEGIASSYGREFHGRTTSNGEPFDMNAMTAAHKTLPMGVYVRVRHKRQRQGCGRAYKTTAGRSSRTGLSICPKRLRKTWGCSGKGLPR